MLGRVLSVKCFNVQLKSWKPNTLPSVIHHYATASGGKKETLPDTDYNWWNKLSSDKYPRGEHWRHKFADIRWQYLQDPEVIKGVTPIIYKESAERDVKNWPTAPTPETGGRVRMLILPEEFFNFLYSKTGVTGPYVIVWGTLAYLWSQEMIRLDNETSLFLELTVLPMFVHHRMFAPRSFKFLKECSQFEHDAFGAYKKVAKGKLELENINDRLDFEMSKSASKYTFEAKKEMFQLQWESTYRRRMSEAYEAVKARLDFHMELAACRARHESKHMVNWIVGSVVSSITPELEKATLGKCLLDLRNMAGSVKL